MQVFLDFIFFISKYFINSNYTFLQLDIEKAHSSLSKVLRAVGSSEPHSLMQYLLFSYAQREEELAGYQSNYRNLTIDQKQSLESWSKKLIQPMRVSLFVALV